LYSGQVWLEAEGSVSSFSRPDPAERPAERTVQGQPSGGSPNEAITAERKTTTFSRSKDKPGTCACGKASPPAFSPPAERGGEKNGAPDDKGESGGEASSQVLSAQRRAAETAERAAIDPHRFVALGDPVWEPCAVCGRKPSSYREKWVRGVTERRRLCKHCYGSAVEREQKKIRPLPTVIDPRSMTRVTASVGQCALCGLEAASWKGEAGRLCDACYQREVRRGLEAGCSVTTSI
jgi:hypothetical protein